MRFGSHLYGTATPKSDLDFKSVFIPDDKSILLGRVQNVIVENTKTDSSARNTADDIDRECFSLQKFLALLAQGNTVALDMFFAPLDSVIEFDPLWVELKNNSDKLLSKQCQSYIGYCRTQANKYGIKGSRMAAAQAATLIFSELVRLGKPTDRVGDAVLCLEAELGGLEHVEFVDITNPAGAVVRHLSVCGRKVPFTQTVKEAHAVYSRLYNEYGTRAQQAKDNQNIDWKAVSHAVRVGRQAVELLDTGHITFPRPEAAHLVAIKTGQLPFDAVAEEIEQLLADVEDAAAKSTLPERPDQSFIDQIVYNTYRDKVIRGNVH